MKYYYNVGIYKIAGLLIESGIKLLGHIGFDVDFTLNEK